ATGETVIGASISEVGTTNGTITDFDGNFELQVQKGAQLEISYVGFKTVKIAATPNMSVALEEDKALLEEVVVIGYGSVKKNDATGSVTAIKPDDMNKGLNTNAQDMLSGKIAGVAVTSDGGTPGGSSTIRIRGGSSLNANNNPLIVIDGLAMDNNGIKGAANALSMINPSDIETFTVLKDASATAIYGSRASNGVIITTTKKGTAGSKPKFSYEGNVSMGNLVNRLETLTGDELREHVNNSIAQADIVRQKSLRRNLNYFGNYNTDWQNYIYRPAISTDHNFSVMGGTKNMPYRASLGYTLNNGTIHTSQMQRVTASINLNPSFLDKHLTFNLNAKGMYIYNRYADGSVVGSALSMDPTQPVYGGSHDATNAKKVFDGEGSYIRDGVEYPYHEVEGDIIQTWFSNYYQRIATAEYHDGNWPYTKNSQTTANPVATLRQKNDRAHSGAFVGNLEADYKIHGFEDLRLHANFGADYSYGKQTTSIDNTSYSNYYYGWEGWSEEKKYNLQFNAYAQYYKDFNENHHFDVMLGYEWQHFHRQGSSDGWGSYPLNSLTTDDDGNVIPNPLAGQMAKNTRSTNEYETESYLVSFFGRLNYIALNRYMITATVRADGSSRFKKNRRWGVFPSVALGWKIKEEAFLRDVYWLSDLKLRLGYGITGQQEITSNDYPYITMYNISKEHAYYPIGSDVNIVYDEDGNPLTDADGNPMYLSYRPGAISEDLTWEKTTTYNAGLDFGFLKGRITGSVDYYYRKTDDLINYVDVPVGANFSNRVLKNIGSLTNQGVEVSLNAVAIDKPAHRSKFKWDMGLNFTWNQNRITSLNIGEGDSFVRTGGISSGLGDGYIQAHKKGYAASVFHYYETAAGFDASGNKVYYAIDTNKDGDVTDEDRVMNNNIVPMAPYTLGFQSKWQFFNFDISFSLRASIGNYVYNDVLAGSVYSAADANLCSSQNGGYHGVLKDAYNAYYNDKIQPDKMLMRKWDAAKGAYVDSDTPFNQYALTDIFIENASFIRCDNITVGYTFDKNPNVKARIYATVQNPFVITGYSGLDPEHFGGIDNNIYPRCTTSLIGLSLQF
ncbi:MAG: SusC/RagA family TonB-linked outer membrane protein, partial [Paludibacteraceae bacterium]|nr:SusC/RagA family TonB-linked outer membrane protein [Paludibacteraceae bacterium]